MTDADTLEKLLGLQDKAQGSSSSTAARAAAGQERWCALVRRVNPRPSWWAFRRRPLWQQAFDAVTAHRPRSRLMEAVVIPIWICCNNSDEPAVGRFERKALFCGVHDGDVDEELETDGVPDQLLFVRGECTERGWLAPIEVVDSGEPTLFRNQAYAVIARSPLERIVGIDEERPLPPQPAPTQAVPPWDDEAVSAVDLSGLDEELRRRIESALEDLRFDNDDD